MKNIELKVKVDSFKAIRNALITNNAKKDIVLHQIDTYFQAEHGRLKLREINGETFQMIYYERPNKTKSKLSTYSIVPLSRNASQNIKSTLKKSNGLMVLVEKKRELWFNGNTRIHLDTVKNLGKFIELETVVNGISLKQALSEHKNVINLLGLDSYEKYSMSYSDLLMT